MSFRIVLTVCILFIFATAASAEVRYVVTDLGPIDADGHYARGLAVNNSRQVVCGQTTGGPLFLWDHGASIQLNIRASAIPFKLTDINDAGQVVGRSESGLPCVWHDGSVTELGAAPGYALGINNAGQVCGMSGSAPFLWDNGALMDITPAEWTGPAYACSISDGGVIVGSNRGTACVWTNGIGARLDLPGTTSSEAWSVNSRGDIVGWWTLYGSSRTAFMYSNGIALDIGGVAHPGVSRANSINDAGQIVGYCFNADSPRIPWPGRDPIYVPNRAVLWDDGAMSDLNDLIAPGSGLVLTQAWDINDRGDIVGEALAPDTGGLRSYLLTPWLLEVPVDILPGIEPNIINLRSRGNVLVLVLSTEEFDASRIDWSTVRLAGAGLVRHCCGDMNRDGHTDAALAFRSSDLDLYSDSISAELTGKTVDGRPFHGSDSVCVRGGFEAPKPLVPRYSVSVCEPLEGRLWSMPYHMNGLGQVVGECEAIPCVWSSGWPTSLDIPGSRFISAYDINDSGQVALWTDAGGRLWWNGAFTGIDVPGLRVCLPQAINNSGCVVGWGPYPLGEDWVGRRAFIWRNGEGRLLDPPVGESSWAVDVNDSGVVAGYCDVFNEARTTSWIRPCVWIDGVGRELALPELSDEGWPYAINGRGYVAGFCRMLTWDYGDRACVWRDGLPQLLKRIQFGSYDRAFALNDWSQVVGDTHLIAQTTGLSHRVMLWHAGVPYDLSSLITDLPQGWNCYSAVDINNAGQIAVDASNPDGYERALVLTPIPTEVGIDIEPGDPHNTINARSHGVLPVAILAGDGFTAASLVPETVVLAGAAPRSWKTDLDINNDGRNDVLLLFRTDDLRLSNGESELVLKGRTFDGWWIEGIDEVRVHGVR